MPRRSSSGSAHRSLHQLLPQRSAPDRWPVLTLVSVGFYSTHAQHTEASLTSPRRFNWRWRRCSCSPGIAGLLNVMTGRLARIIDRGRALTEERVVLPEADRDAELRSLEQRRHFTSIAIMACTAAALFLCTVIVALFIEVLLSAPVSC